MPGFSDCFDDVSDLTEGLLARITVADSVNLSLASTAYRPLLTQKLRLLDTLSIRVKDGDLDSFVAALCKLRGLERTSLWSSTVHLQPSRCLRSCQNSVIPCQSSPSVRLVGLCGQRYAKQQDIQ